jgi:hypothetical protein
MLIHKSNSAYNELGCVLFAIEGSPPKGYGLYVPKHNYLVIINAWGKAKTIKNVSMVDIEDYGDNDIVEAPN